MSRVPDESQQQNAGQAAIRFTLRTVASNFQLTNRTEITSYNCEAFAGALDFMMQHPDETSRAEISEDLLVDMFKIAHASFVTYVLQMPILQGPSLEEAILKTKNFATFLVSTNNFLINILKNTDKHYSQEEFEELLGSFKKDPRKICLEENPELAAAIASLTQSITPEMEHVPEPRETHNEHAEETSGGSAAAATPPSLTRTGTTTPTIMPLDHPLQHAQEDGPSEAQRTTSFSPNSLLTQTEAIDAKTHAKVLAMFNAATQKEDHPLRAADTAYQGWVIEVLSKEKLPTGSYLFNKYKTVTPVTELPEWLQPERSVETELSQVVSDEVALAARLADSHGRSPMSSAVLIDQLPILKATPALKKTKTIEMKHYDAIKNALQHLEGKPANETEEEEGTVEEKVALYQAMKERGILDSTTIKVFTPSKNRIGWGSTERYPLPVRELIAWRNTIKPTESTNSVPWAVWPDPRELVDNRSTDGSIKDFGAAAISLLKMADKDSDPQSQYHYLLADPIIDYLKSLNAGLTTGNQTDVSPTAKKAPRLSEELIERVQQLSAAKESLLRKHRKHFPAHPDAMKLLKLPNYEEPNYEKSHETTTLLEGFIELAIPVLQQDEWRKWSGKPENLMLSKRSDVEGGRLEKDMDGEEYYRGWTFRVASFPAPKLLTAAALRVYNPETDTSPALQAWIDRVNLQASHTSGIINEHVSIQSEFLEALEETDIIMCRSKKLDELDQRRVNRRLRFMKACLAHEYVRELPTKKPLSPTINDHKASFELLQFAALDSKDQPSERDLVTAAYQELATHTDGDENDNLATTISRIIYLAAQLDNEPPALTMEAGPSEGNSTSAPKNLTLVAFAAQKILEIGEIITLTNQTGLLNKAYIAVKEMIEQFNDQDAEAEQKWNHQANDDLLSLKKEALAEKDQVQRGDGALSGTGGGAADHSDHQGSAKSSTENLLSSTENLLSPNMKNLGNAIDGLSDVMQRVREARDSTKASTERAHDGTDTTTLKETKEEEEEVFFSDGDHSDAEEEATPFITEQPPKKEGAPTTTTSASEIVNDAAVSNTKSSMKTEADESKGSAHADGPSPHKDDALSGTGGGAADHSDPQASAPLATEQTNIGRLKQEILDLSDVVEGLQQPAGSSPAGTDEAKGTSHAVDANAPASKDAITAHEDTELPTESKREDTPPITDAEVGEIVLSVFKKALDEESQEKENAHTATPNSNASAADMASTTNEGKTPAADGDRSSHQDGKVHPEGAATATGRVHDGAAEEPTPPATATDIAGTTNEGEAHVKAGEPEATDPATHGAPVADMASTTNEGEGPAAATGGGHDVTDADSPRQEAQKSQNSTPRQPKRDQLSTSLPGLWGAWNSNPNPNTDASADKNPSPHN